MASLDALDLSRKLISSRPVVRRNRSSVVHTHVAAVIGREDNGVGGADVALANLFAIHVEGNDASFAEAAAFVGELHVPGGAEGLWAGSIR